MKNNDYAKKWRQNNPEKYYRSQRNSIAKKAIRHATKKEHNFYIEVLELNEKIRERLLTIGFEDPDKAFLEEPELIDKIQNEILSEQEEEKYKKSKELKNE